MSACPKLSDLCAFRSGYFSQRGSDPIEKGQICHPRGRVAYMRHSMFGRPFCATDYTKRGHVDIRECETTALYLLENGLGFWIYAEGMCACGEGSHRTVVAVCR